MAFWPFGKKKKQDDKVVQNPDGSMTTTTSFQLSGDTLRPVDDDVVAAFDEALGGLGGEVMHALDPRRLQTFAAGGPPIWSVGIVYLPNQTLLLTYGLSHALSPEPERAAIDYEFSLALPVGQSPQPWADALLRHISRYVLSSGKALELGDVMPCYAPITCIPFPPAHHGMMPNTGLEGLVVAPDPSLPTITTPKGDVQVRRLLGVDQAELDRAETWSGSGFAQEFAKADPLLLTDLTRSSRMEDAAFVATSSARASEEGSMVPAVLMDVYWQLSDQGLAIEFPGGSEATKLLNAIHGRLGFDRPLLVACKEAPPIEFVPSDHFSVENSERGGLILAGRIDDPNMAHILSFIRPEYEEVTTVQLNISVK